MDAINLFSKLKELGHVNSKREELQLLCRLKLDQILKYLPRRILDSDGGDLLDCILNGLPDNPTSSCKQATKLIDIVLQCMRKESTSLTHCGDVISRLCLELSRQPADELVRWSNDSIQSIIHDNDVNMIWRDVLPECLSALSAYNEIKHCGTTMTSDEYKQQCIHTLCQCQWTERQLVQLVAMFKDMQMQRAEHKQVVNKICSYIIDIPPDVLPPLVHQLLKFCKLYDTETVLAHLSHYFSVRLYSKLEPPPQDSESTTMDIDDIVPHSSAELSRCLSTCIYHITEGAADPEVIRKHLKAWPKTQLLRQPFLLDVALAISDKGSDFKSACLDVIKSAIEERVVDGLRNKDSAWVRAVLPPDVDVASVLKVLTTESANHRQLTVMGLINLAFALLAVPSGRAWAAACWSHAKLLLARLSRAQPEVAPHVLGQLADRLAGGNALRQYADCLFVLCKLTPVSLERCTQLSTILESCQPSPTDYRAAAAVLDAVYPLINFSTRTRDTMVMVCRKGLYSRDSHHRCLALSGFLTVLRHVKISRSTVCSSQSGCSDQFSAHSYLTQMAVELHATQQGAVVTSRVRNEAMCMEVVSILRRCLVQDAAVKQLLYTQLYDCARDKAALHESILELLYEHLTKYLPEADGDSAPLRFDKCVQINGAFAVLTEPISHLLYVIAQFLQSNEEEDLEDILSSQNADTGSAYLRSKLTNIVENLCSSSSFGNIDMVDPSLTELSPAAKAKCLKVQQILQCYEALVAHRILQWKPDSRGVADSVYNLYKASASLLDQTRAPPKVSKKSNKSLNETKDTVKSQKSQKSQKDKAKAPTKLSALVKDRGGAFKAPPCVWDLRFCVRLVELLYRKSQKSQKDIAKGPTKLSALVKDRGGAFKPSPCVWDFRFCVRLVELLYSENVSWCSTEERNILRARRDFHAWALRGVGSQLTAHVSAHAHSGRRAVAAYAPVIAAILYRRCLCRFEEMCEFDDQTTLSCIEVFKACLALLLSPNYSLKLESFLPVITDIEDATASSGIAAILEQLHKALVATEADGAQERDAMLGKLLAALIQTAALLLDTPVVGCPKYSAVIIQLEEYLRISKSFCLSLVPGVLAAECRDQAEATLMPQLLGKLVTALGYIDEDETSATEDTAAFPSVDARSGHQVLNYVCEHLGSRFKHTDHLLARARDLALAQNTAVHGHQQRVDRELRELYRSLVVQLCQLCAWCSRACSLRCCVGAGSNCVLTAAVKMYGLLANFFKQLPVALAAGLKLERLLKVCGKKLSSRTDTLVTYVEAAGSAGATARGARGVLRDTRLIPRLVLEQENLSRHVILLANKAKLNLQHYLSLGTARDFRIRAPLLQEALQRADAGAADAEDDETEANINDAATDILSPVASDGDAPSDGETPTRKRRRVS